MRCEMCDYVQSELEVLLVEQTIVVKVCRFCGNKIMKNSEFLRPNVMRLPTIDGRVVLNGRVKLHPSLH